MGCYICVGGLRVNYNELKNYMILWKNLRN